MPVDSDNISIGVCPAWVILETKPWVLWRAQELWELGGLLDTSCSCLFLLIIIVMESPSPGTQIWYLQFEVLTKKFFSPSLRVLQEQGLLSSVCLRALCCVRVGCGEWFSFSWASSRLGSSRFCMPHHLEMLITLSCQGPVYSGEPSRERVILGLDKNGTLSSHPNHVLLPE